MRFGLRTTHTCKIHQEVNVDITEVRISLRNEDKLKAFASITFDDCFVVRGLKVISGSQGYFVSMPSRKRKDGSYQDLAHPINNEMRKQIESSVLDAFEAELNRSGGVVAPGVEHEDEHGGGTHEEHAFEEEEAHTH